MASIQEQSETLDLKTHEAIRMTFRYCRHGGVSQTAIAEKLGLHGDVVSRWHTGRSPFSAKNALGLYTLVQEIIASGPISTRPEAEALVGLVKLWKEVTELRKQLAGRIQHDIGSNLARLDKKDKLNLRERQEQVILVSEAHRIAIALEQCIMFSAAWAACRDSIIEAAEKAIEDGLVNDSYLVTQ